LLSLNRFESDAEQIARAADAAMAKVRQIRPGEHAAQWSRLLDQLNAAKTCLLDPAKRKVYDARLTNPAAAKARQPAPATQQAAKPAPAKRPATETQPRVPFPAGSAKPAIPANAKAGASPPPATREPTAESSLFNEDLMAEMAQLPPADLGPAPITSPVGKPSAKSIRVRPVYAVVLVAAVAILGLVKYLTSGPKPSSARRGPIQTMVSPPARPSSSTPGTATPAPQPPQATPAPAPAPTPSSTPAAQKQTPPASPAPASSEFVDPAFSNEPAQTNASEAEAAKKQAAEAAKRQAEEAARLQAEKAKAEAAKPKVAVDPKVAATFAKAVAAARTALANRNAVVAKRQIADAAESAQTPEDNDQVDRLQTMQENLTQFWDGIHQSMAKLQAAEEIVVKDTRIVVIESTRDVLAVKALGRVHRFRITDMPTSLVMALVTQNFGRDAGSKAIIATFLAVDPSGDRSLAKQYWREAASAGIDCEKLLPEADAMPPVVNRQKPEK
jgi:hypothetical protein